MTSLPPALPPALGVMTFNVRRRIDGMPWRRSDRWSTRHPRVVQMLRTARPTLLGLQEVMPSQGSAIAAALGDDYSMIGRGRRADGRGEACPVAFDHTRLQLLSWEQRALSDEPEVPGSRTWGNLVPRIAIAARFRDLATGAEFSHVNTHLDPYSRRSQALSAIALRELVAGFDAPTVLTGDLNAGADSPALYEFLLGGVLRDAWDVAARRSTPEWGTYTNYRAPRMGRARLDWILVTAGIRVADIAIDARRYGGGWPSDHLPVHALLEVTS